MYSSCKLYAIADFYTCANFDISVIDFARAFFDAGGKLLQYRDKLSSPKLLESNLEKLLQLKEQYSDTLIIINDHLELAVQYDIMLHLGQEDLKQHTLSSYFASVPFGLSTHQETDLNFIENMKHKPQYIGFGSIFDSKTKKKKVAKVSPYRICNITNIPIVFIGGITLDNINVLPQGKSIYYAIIQDFFRFGNTARDIYKYTNTYFSQYNF